MRLLKSLKNKNIFRSKKADEGAGAIGSEMIKLIIIVLVILFVIAWYYGLYGKAVQWIKDAFKSI